MIGTTSGQLPKKAVSAMVYAEMNPMSPLEMGSEIQQRTTGAFDTQKCLEPFENLHEGQVERSELSSEAQER